MALRWLVDVQPSPVADSMLRLFAVTTCEYRVQCKGLPQRGPAALAGSRGLSRAVQAAGQPNRDLDHWLSLDIIYRVDSGRCRRVNCAAHGRWRQQMSTGLPTPQGSHPPCSCAGQQLQTVRRPIGGAQSKMHTTRCIHPAHRRALILLALAGHGVLLEHASALQGREGGGRPDQSSMSKWSSPHVLGDRLRTTWAA